MRHLPPEPEYRNIMDRRIEMAIYYECHPDCPHMYECIVDGMRCKPYEIPNFAIIDEEITRRLI